MTTLSAGFLLMLLGLCGVFIALICCYFFMVACTRIAKRAGAGRPPQANG